MTFPEESKGPGCGELLVAGLLVLALGLGVGAGLAADQRTASIRADLATQGCVLVQRDAGEGQTWRVECEGEGR
jgi:hypothetical protein